MASDITQFFKKTHQKFKDFRGKVAAMKQEHENEGVLRPDGKIAAGSKPQKLELILSARTIAKFVIITIVLLIVTAFVYQIRDILVVFFVSLLFAAALDPMVDALERRKIPRALGVIIIYFVILLLVGLFISNLAPIIAREVSQLAGKIQDFVINIVHGKIILPKFMESIRPVIQKMFEGLNISQIGDYKDILLNFANRLSDIAGNVFNAILAISNGFFNAVLIFVLTFLMTVDEKAIDKFFLSLFPTRYADYIRQKSEAVKGKMGYWLRGQIVLCVVVGILVYIGFFIIGLFTQPVEYAATIAMVAGLTEIIPYAGPLIAWIIAIPVVANQSLILIVWVTILMYIVQFLENNFIVPMVMHKAVDISPIFVMFAMLVGFEFLGILGMLLAVPVAAGAAIFLKDYADKEK